MSSDFIRGVVERGGVKSEFMIPLDSDDANYNQWGADTEVLGERVDLLTGMAHAAREWYAEGDTLETDPPLFTVVGYWDDDDKRHVTGVLAGEHSLTGGDDASEGGPFAVLVNAENEQEAEALVEGSDESTEGIE